jgi:hypothetical protein
VEKALCHIFWKTQLNFNVITTMFSNGKDFVLGHHGRAMVEIGRDYEGELFSSVVIDGNNAITVSSRTINDKMHYKFSLERLFNTIQSVEELGWRTLTVLKVGTYGKCIKKSSDLTDGQREVLKKMKNTSMIHIIEGTNEDRHLDDKIMIEHALNHDAWILTGDTFRKDHLPKLFKEQKFLVMNEINKRRVNLSFGPDNKPLFCLPQNLDALAATKVVSDTQNVELELLSGGCPILISVPDEEDVSGVVTMREPVGRKGLLDIAKSPKFNDAMNAVSRNHFKIDWDGSDFYLTDLNSTNGTKINDLKIPPHQPQRLSENDEIRIGSVIMTLQ